MMVQKTNQGKWISTTQFTKIGRPGKVATNYKQGGSIGYFRPTMKDKTLYRRIMSYAKQYGRKG